MTITFEPGQLDTAASTCHDQASDLGSQAQVQPIPADAFGVMLGPPGAAMTERAANGVNAFFKGANHGFDSMGDQLSATANGYRGLEHANAQIATSITGGGGGLGAAPMSATQAPVDGTTRDHWSKAGLVLEQGSSTGADKIDVPSIALSWLKETKNPVEMAESAIIDMLFTHVRNQFQPFKEWVDQLAGDPAQIESGRDDFNDRIDPLGAAALTAAGLGPSMSQWTGEGATAFGNYASTAEHTMTSAQDVEKLFGPSIEATGRAAAALRHAVFRSATVAINRVVTDVVPLLAGFVKYGAAKAVNSIPFIGDKIVSDEEVAQALDEAIQRVVQIVGEELASLADSLSEISTAATGNLGQLGQLGQSMQRAGSLLQNGTDPGPGNTVTPGSVADSMTGTDHDPRDGMLINLMDGDTSGLTEVTGDDLSSLGLDPSMLKNDANGFEAHVYRDANGNVIVKFEGTDFGDSQQRDMLQENVPGGVGVGPQSQMAMDIANRLANSPDHDRVIYAGHSLGGRLAAEAAMTSGNPAVTANAAGVSPATERYIAEQQGVSVDELRQRTDNGLVRGYRTQDDILTDLQERRSTGGHLMPSAPGSHIRLPGEDRTFLGEGSGHGSDNVNDQYDKQYRGEPVPSTMGPTNP